MSTPPYPPAAPAQCDRSHLPEAVLYVILAAVVAIAGALVAIRILGQ